MTTQEEFLQSMEVAPTQSEKALRLLFQGVIDTNKLIGLEEAKSDRVEREKLSKVYKGLCEEEYKEVLEAVDKQDRINFVKEVIDYLVVAGYLYYLNRPVAYPYVEKADNLLVLEEGFSGFKEAGDSQDYGLALDYAVYMFHSLSIDHVAAVKQVLSSNLSKFSTAEEMQNYLYIYEDKEEYMKYRPEDTEKVLQWQCDQLEGERYQGVHWEAVKDDDGNTRYVFWSTKVGGKPQRKYLKGASYFEADLSGVFK